MKRIALAFALATSLSAGLSTAQAQTAEELANTYVNMPEVQQMMTNMFSPQNMSAQIMASIPPGTSMTESQQTAIGELMSREMNALRPQIESLTESMVAETFSVEEISALIDFYSSEHGASIMQKMPTMMQQVMGSLAPEIRAMQTRIVPELIQIMNPED